MEETWSVVRAERDPAVMRTVACAALVGLLSPVTGAGILLACDYIRWHGTAVTPDFYMRHGRDLVVTFVVLSSLPAAVVTGISLSILPTLPERGLSPRSLLPFCTAVGAICGVLITGPLLGSWKPPDVWVLGAALNGAMWGLLVAAWATRGSTAR
jgi:hypothetical protein